MAKSAPPLPGRGLNHSTVGRHKSLPPLASVAAASTAQRDQNSSIVAQRVNPGSGRADFIGDFVRHHAATWPGSGGVANSDWMKQLDVTTEVNEQRQDQR